jgi:hypothetical protein
MPGAFAASPSTVGNGMQPYAMQQQPALGFQNQAADRAALKAQEKLAKEQEKAAVSVSFVWC